MIKVFPSLMSRSPLLRMDKQPEAVRPVMKLKETKFPKVKSLNDREPWFINKDRSETCRELKKLSEANQGNCCIRPGSKDKTYALSYYDGAKDHHYVISEDKGRYKLQLQEPTQWVGSLNDILDYFVEKHRSKAIPVHMTSPITPSRRPPQVDDSDYLEPSQAFKDDSDEKITKPDRYYHNFEASEKVQTKLKPRPLPPRPHSEGGFLEVKQTDYINQSELESDAQNQGEHYIDMRGKRNSPSQRRSNPDPLPVYVNTTNNCPK